VPARLPLIDEDVGTGAAVSRDHLEAATYWSPGCAIR